MRIDALLCPFALAWFLLSSSACAQSTQGPVASPAQTVPASREEEAQALRLQMQQIRRDFEQQIDVLERRLDTLESAHSSDPPNTSDAQRLQQAVTGLANNGPSSSAQQQSPSESKAGAQQQVPDAAADQASREKTERTIAGKNEGKTPTYQNLNDQENPAIQQAKAFEFHGYLRSGEGINSHGGQQVAFEAPGAPAKYRLGNETDTYGEFVFANNWINTHAPQDHAWFHTEVLISADTTESAQGDSTDTFNLKEAFVRGGNLFASHPDWKFWAGERYYCRWNIDQIDWYMQDMSGYGGGVEDVHLGGPVKIAFAYLGGVNDADKLKSGYF
jgi:maltoporin